MQIIKTTVDELYSMSGFETMIEEYATHAIKSMPKPNYPKEVYEAMEKAGILSVFCVKSSDRVVGFMSVLLTKIPHYGATCGIVESIFVQKQFRTIGVGLRFINQAKAHSSAAQAAGLFVSCPWGQKAFAGLLEAEGFTAETISYFTPL